MVNRMVMEYYAEAFTSIITGSPYDEHKPFLFKISDQFTGGTQKPNTLNSFES
jgi:hypothetical protein